jgi:hypothetical protein
MIKHRSGTRWPDNREDKGDEDREFLGSASKPRSTVSPGLATKSVPFPQNLDSLSSSKIERKIFGFGKNLFENLFLVLR